MSCAPRVFCALLRCVVRIKVFPAAMSPSYVIRHDKNDPLFGGFFSVLLSKISVSPGRKKVNLGKPTEKWVIFIRTGKPCRLSAFRGHPPARARIAAPLGQCFFELATRAAYPKRRGSARPLSAELFCFISLFGTGDGGLFQFIHPAHAPWGICVSGFWRVRWVCLRRDVVPMSPSGFLGGMLSLFSSENAQIPTRWPSLARLHLGNPSDLSRRLDNEKGSSYGRLFRIWGVDSLTKGGVVCQQGNGGAVMSGCAAGLTECGVCFAGPSPSTAANKGRSLGLHECQKLHKRNGCYGNYQGDHGHAGGVFAFVAVHGGNHRNNGHDGQAHDGNHGYHYVLR